MRKTDVSMVVFCIAMLLSLGIYEAYNRFFKHQTVAETTLPEVTVSKLQLSRLDFVRDTLRNYNNRGKFNSWEHLFNNEVEQYIGTLKHEGATYQLVAFPDGLLLTTDAGISNGNIFVIFDRNFDGTVEVGSSQSVFDGTETKKFDIAIKEGVDYQDFYQGLYNRSMIKVGDLLGF